MSNESDREKRKFDEYLKQQLATADLIISSSKRQGARRAELNFEKKRQKELVKVNSKTMTESTTGKFIAVTRTKHELKIGITSKARRKKGGRPKAENRKKKEIVDVKGFK